MTVEVRLHRIEGRAMYGAAHRPGIPGCSARRTYERVVKLFGSTVKKVVRIEIEIWEKMWGYIAE